jgi:hypothetical protein
MLLNLTRDPESVLDFCASRMTLDNTSGHLQTNSRSGLQEFQDDPDFAERIEEFSFLSWFWSNMDYNPPGDEIAEEIRSNVWTHPAGFDEMEVLHSLSKHTDKLGGWLPDDCGRMSALFWSGWLELVPKSNGP